MPGINGEDQSGREYAPFFYILAIDGDKNNDNDYHFVGQTRVEYEMEVNPSFFPEHTSSNCSKVLKPGETIAQYHLGINVIGKLVADLGVTNFTNSDTHCPRGIPTELIPRQVRVNYLSVAISKMGERDTHPMLAACGLKIPAGLKPITINDYLNDAPDLEDRKAEWDTARDEIREKYFPGWEAHYKDFWEKLDEDPGYADRDDVDYDLDRIESHSLTFIDNYKPFDGSSSQQ